MSFISKILEQTAAVRLSPLYESIQKNFGSYDHWKEDFIGTGLMRGIGWAVLYQDPISGSLVDTLDQRA